jgi:hypothetical protein
VVRAVERALDGTLDRSYSHLTSLDFSNAFNTVDRRDTAEVLRQYAPVLYRAGRWAYDCTSSLSLSSPEGIQNITSAQGVRQGDPMGPLMFSLGIGALLRDLASCLRQRLCRQRAKWMSRCQSWAEWVNIAMSAQGFASIAPPSGHSMGSNSLPSSSISAHD